jgi:hypothetical protein
LNENSLSIGKAISRISNFVKDPFKKANHQPTPQQFDNISNTYQISNQNEPVTKNDNKQVGERTVIDARQKAKEEFLSLI